MDSVDNEYQQLSKELQTVIAKMQKVQAAIAGDSEPASMHELDQLTRLGKQYAATVDRIAQLKTDQKKQLS